MRESWTDDRMDDLNGKVDLLRVEMKTEFAAVRGEANERFDKIERRFDKMEERFEKVDERFERAEFAVRSASNEPRFAVRSASKQ